MTDDLAAFIAARLDEDEAAATEAAREECPEWRRRYPNPGLYEGTTDISDINGTIVARAGTPIAAHIARHDPARGLREVAAKRRVLERHRPVGGNPSYWAQACAGCGTEGYCDDPVTAKMSDCPELRDMAAIWDAHPDYRQEWKPWP
jgi:Family of unknown function (DUF6221)